MKERKKLFFLAIIIFFNFIIGITSCGLFDIDEAVFSEVSREMVSSGDYAVPAFNGKPFLEKPVLFYWAQVLSYKIFGINDFAARLPGTIASFVLIIIIYTQAGSVFGSRVALISSLALSFNILVGVLSKAATTDSFLLLFISSAILFFLRGMFESSRSCYLLFYVCAALAGLVKGPVGFLIPFSVVLVSAIFSGHFTELKKTKPVAGLILFLLILLPWYILVSIRTDGTFIKEFLLYQNVSRFGMPFEGHSGGLLYYVPVILFGFFPFSAFLPSAFSKLNLTDKKNIYVLTWSIIPFILFSIARTKLPNYILPSFPPLAIIAATWIEKHLVDGEKPFLPLCLLILLSAIFCTLLYFTDDIIGAVKLVYDNPFLRQDISMGAGIKIFSIIFFLALSILSIFAIKKKNVFIMAVTATGFVFNLFLCMYFIPKVWNYIQAGLQQLSLEVKKQPGSELIVYGIYNPSINFYAGKQAVIVPKENPESVKKLTSEYKKTKKKFLIITDDKLSKLLPGYLKEIKKVPGYTLIGLRAEYRSVGVTQPLSPAVGGWKRIYIFLRKIDLDMFSVINAYPGYPVIDYAMMFFTMLGNGLYLTLIVALLLYFYDKRNFTFNFILFLIIITAGGLLVQIIKSIADNPRPLNRLDHVRILLEPLRERAFPSGHTQTAFSAAFFLSTRIKKFAVMFFGIAFLVGYSRIYIGVHFPSDVFAGAGIGIITTGLILALFEERLNRKFEKNS
ncbi:MAG: phosphatase PAP2 family protein [Elusimicrobiota bacterium]